ncbi:arginine ABC transporter substrate-binding protein [Legionella beliardensis]|uniref:Arginine ABC transporter substrate-binding protein n=1 Tax=Legionella beliardensis TaxID=91822 RepID=A0A378I2E7_9GAMM|nr:transporter substrate-binding domain-containing protein [Legionella beliardensis]STX29367.1 arginine ABC transporter substrate-binding protein [Legionella beliardensis]
MLRKLSYFILISILYFVSPSYAAVKVGILQFDPPFVTTDKRFVLSGFDIELMKCICSELNWSCKFVIFKDYSKLIDALLTNNVDYAMSGIVITPLKNPNLLFSIPYLISAGNFITLKSNTEITNLASLQNKKVGVLAGRGYGEYLKQNPSALNLQVVDYYNYMDLLNDFYTKKVDAIFLNNYTAMYLLHQYPDFVKLINTSISFANGIGILSRADNKENIDRINALLTRFETDGTFVTLYNYNFAFFVNQ